MGKEKKGGEGTAAAGASKGLGLGLLIAKPGKGGAAAGKQEPLLGKGARGTAAPTLASIKQMLEAQLQELNHSLKQSAAKLDNQVATAEAAIQKKAAADHAATNEVRCINPHYCTCSSSSSSSYKYAMNHHTTYPGMHSTMGLWAA